MSVSLNSAITFGQNLRVFPLEYIPDIGVAESKHPGLSNREIIFEDFQPM